MLNRFKKTVTGVIGNISSWPEDSPEEATKESKKIKYIYNRPEFLQLNSDEVQVSADHFSRPIVVPRNIAILPWNSGYAEVVNGGKTKLNEDQARASVHFLPGVSENKSCSSDGVANGGSASEEDADGIENISVPLTYFAVFDGHAGSGASLMAVNLLHVLIQKHLQKVREILIKKKYHIEDENNSPSDMYFKIGNKMPDISVDSLVIGALETAFLEMDQIILEERQVFRITGGCTVLVALFLFEKLYVANAGDSRAIICRGNDVIAMSEDFTPHRERQRLQQTAVQQPELLNAEFTHLEFSQRLTKRDLGTRVLYRDAWMTGWSFKTVTQEDLKFPLIYGEGKRARVLATIGVTRGFGDHGLTVFDTDIKIKPFLSPVPEVRVYDLSSYKHTEDDVLLMATDGLWDVISNEEAAIITKTCLTEFDPSDSLRYTSAAQELVMNARGILKHENWCKFGEGHASADDITVFVIPLHCYDKISELADPNPRKAESPDESLSL